MIYIQKAIGFQTEKKTAVTLGKFDGLHLGHQKLIERIRKRKEELSTAVIVFNIKQPQILLTPEERRCRLETKQVDYLLEYDFDETLKHMEPEFFIEEILVKNLQASYIAVGTDFHFGKDRRGDTAMLQQMAGRFGYEVDVVEKETYRDTVISSTVIKEKLAAGDIAQANEMLGYAYTVRGVVENGRKLGRTIGIPTTNLIPRKEKALPPNGVYVSYSRIKGQTYGGITNIGYKPTVGAEKFKGIETFVFDFDEDIYGETIEVLLLDYERPEQNFPSLDALKAQLAKDVAYGREFLNG